MKIQTKTTNKTPRTRIFLPLATPLVRAIFKFVYAALENSFGLVRKRRTECAACTCARALVRVRLCVCVVRSNNAKAKPTAMFSFLFRFHCFCSLCFGFAKIFARKIVVFFSYNENWNSRTVFSTFFFVCSVAVRCLVAFPNEKYEFSFHLIWLLIGTFCRARSESISRTFLLF